MFAQGLHDCVDIRSVQSNAWSRTDKNHLHLTEEPVWRAVPCRIIRDEKVLFAGEMVLGMGYTLTDTRSGTVYQIKDEGKYVRGMGRITHHTTYAVAVYKLGDRNAGF